MRTDLTVARLAVAAAMVVGAQGVASAASTKTHGVTPEELLRGRADGISVAGDGTLSVSPAVRRLGTSENGSAAAQVWSLATDDAGAVYLGTGPDGQVIRISASGAESVHARVPDPLVTALLRLPDGTLLAGASPSGLVYRIAAGGEAVRWAETGSRYVWDLVRTGDGRLFAAVGEPGGIVRIADDGNVRDWFDARESHVRVVEELPGGDLLAGGAGHGTLYRIDRDGHAFVVHDDPMPEIAGLAILPDGDVLAAVVAPPPAPDRRPALRIELPGDPRFGPAGQIDALDDTEPTVVEGFIEGLAGDGHAEPNRLRGKVLRIRPDGTAAAVWTSTSEAPFAVGVDRAGRALFGTGEPARVYEVADDHVALLASLDEGQITVLAPLGPTMVLATSNPAGAHRLDRDHAEPGAFLSAVIDAGGPVRWGSIRWWSDRFPAPVEMYTRTGNGSAPDDTWSAWSPVLTDRRGSDIVNPDGRFLQWRLKIAGGAAADVGVADVRVSYEPFNRPPEVRGVHVSEPAGRSTTRVAWSARDPDGDPLDARIEFRPAAGGTWSTVKRLSLDAPGPDGPVDRWREGSADIRLDDLAEGPWNVRVVVDDAAANVPGEDGRDSSGERTTVVVDRTAPAGSVIRGEDGSWRVDATDAGSGLRDAALTRDGQPVARLRPRDGVCDDAAETFDVRLPPDLNRGTLAIRLTDAAGNVADLPLGP